MLKELKKIFSNKMLVATLVAVSILPVIYGGLYLYAFWDPYGKIENIPIAVVNLDTGSKKENEIKYKNSKTYNFGNELVDKLKEDPAMNWQFVDLEDAEKGLNTRKYYSIAIIPENFSKNILSVDTNHPEKALLQFKTRQATNFMTSKFADTAYIKIKASLNEKISKEYFENIFEETKDSSKDLDKAVDGSNELNNGLDDAKNGSNDLLNGTEKLKNGIHDLDSGVSKLYDGSLTLKNGAFDVSTASAALVSGINNAYVGSSSIASGVAELKSGVGRLNYGLDVGQSGVNNLAIISNDINNLINNYFDSHPEASLSAELMQLKAEIAGLNEGINNPTTGLKNNMAALKSGSDQLVIGTESLVVGSNNLKGGLVQVQNGMNKLNSGAIDLKNGSAALSDNLGTARSGTDELRDGVDKLKDGQNSLLNGLNKAKDGANTLKNKLVEAKNKILEKTDSRTINEKTPVLSSPIGLKDISIDIVHNNGTGFAPYFIPLSLWVGAMAIFFLIDVVSIKKILWKEWFGKLGVMALVGTIQVFVLDIVLIKCLSLSVNYVGRFILFTILLSWCFISIQFLLNLYLKEAGKFVSIVLLMLQLTSSAGTYPLETVPNFFKSINPYLPMTYAVAALKEIISGDNLSLVRKESLLLIIMGVIFLALNLTLTKINHLKYRIWRKKK